MVRYVTVVYDMNFLYIYSERLKAYFIYVLDYTAPVPNTRKLASRRTHVPSVGLQSLT